MYICNAHSHTNDVENSINAKLVMQTRVGAGVWNMKTSQQHLLVERTQPSEENKKPLPPLSWEQLSSALDALQEAALEQSWREGFLSKGGGRLFLKKESCQPF